MLSNQSELFNENFVVYITEFGGHEIQLITHLNLINYNKHIFIIYNDSVHLNRFIDFSKNKFKYSSLKLPAYPPISFNIFKYHFTFTKELKKLDFLNYIVSTGDIRNYYYLNILNVITKFRKYTYYIPMDSKTKDVVHYLSKLSVNNIITISSKIFPDAHNKFVVHNIAPNHLRHLKSNNKEESFNIYWIGRLEAQQKNPYEALLIFDSLQYQLEQTHQITLNFIGSGPELHRLQAFAYKRTYNSKINFYEWIEFDNFNIKLKNIDLLLNTSCYEGIPLTILDAIQNDIFTLISHSAAKFLDENNKILVYNSIPDAVNQIINLIQSKL